MKKGDRVKDTLKLPKPGDECVTGTVQGKPDAQGGIAVKWNDGTSTVTNVQLLEVISDD